MESFHWDDHFITGLAEVDKQHHRLVDVINAFGALLVRPGGVGYEELRDVLNELGAYTHYHFTEEERMMEEAGIDVRHVQRQRKEHAAFLDEVIRKQTDITPSDLEAAKPLLGFLTHWLAFHILGSDQSLSRQIRAIEAGNTAEEAYLANEGVKDVALEPLLRALDGLYRQVSERNRELQALNQTLEIKVTERTQALSDANRTLTDLVHRLEIEQQASRRLSDELALANRQLEDMALTDVLTGLPNRRHAMRKMAQAWDESEQEGVPLSCMMIDADGFKKINDTYGHDAGDEVLMRLSRELRDAVRTDDSVCRLGGDEFLIICPHTPLDGALHIAELTRQAVTALRVPIGAGEWHGSISVGVAVRRPGMRDPGALIKAADEGVYAAKRKGRNCVATAD
ncbi:MAG: bacteriohemerythrin [Gammaproteobacteria bacterium]|nr:bacteriohemerythrin [Gammaproteobacteria bacterium]